MFFVFRHPWLGRRINIRKIRGDFYKMENFGLYLNKEYLTSLSKKQLKLLMQEIRILNSLEFWLRLRINLKDEKNKIFSIRNTIELVFTTVSIFNEAIKEYSNNMAPDLLKENLSKELKDKIIETKKRFDNYKNDDFLKVVHTIRNSITFHMKSSVYNDTLQEGKAKEDMLLGIGLSNKIIDFCYVEQYTFIFNTIIKDLPKNIASEEFLDWINDNTISEIKHFLKHIRLILGEQIKGHGYKKYLDYDYTI